MKYEVVLADPPWSYYGDPNKDQAAGKHYPLMSVQELLGLDWPLASPGVLFLWATGPKLDGAMELGRGLGLHYRGVSFVWVKTKRDGTPIGAQGVRPSIVKPTAEFVLAFATRKTGRPLPVLDETVRNVVMAPRTEHSRKPEEVQDRIERLYGPNVRYLELFARRERPGWVCRGDEITALREEG